jgi:Protein of unknown function (DUF2934)
MLKRMETKKAQQIETQAPSVTEEQIRVHAYYLSLERRGAPADALSDWLRAESDLLARAHAAKTSPTDTPIATAAPTRSVRRPAQEKAATASHAAPRRRRSKKTEPAGS